MTRYPRAALEGVNTAFNAEYKISSRVEPLVDHEIVTLVLHEGADAIVAILLPSGEHEILVVGNPSYRTRCDLNLLCQAIAHQWRLVRFSAVAAVNAATDCIRGVTP